MPSPPPLPSSLSTRLQSTIDPLTGNCKHHPSVQLCELVQNNTRWVVRRKLCYKCGSRPQAAGSRHKPGVAVSNPSREMQMQKDQQQKEQQQQKEDQDGGGGRGGGERGSGRQSRSRSASVDVVDRTNNGRRSERRRSTSTSASNHNNSGRRDSTRNINRSQSVNVLAASTQRLDASGRGRRSNRDLVAAAETSGGGGRRTTSMHHRSLNNGHDNGGADVAAAATPTTPGAAAAAVAAPPTGPTPNSSRRTPSSNFHGRALEFTQKVMDSTPHTAAVTPHSTQYHQSTPHSTPGGGGLMPYNNALTLPTLPPTPIDEKEDFDESDPIIMIPVFIDPFNTNNANNAMPPPPPRNMEEMERHQERLEMRRNNIRRDREERRKRRTGSTIKNGQSKKSDNKVMPELVKERKSLGESNTGRSARQDKKEKNERANGSSGDAVPSPAALAMLHGTPREKHRDKPKHSGGNDAAHPSPGALALLESNLKSSERRSSSRRHSRAAPAAAAQPPRGTPSKKDQIDKLTRLHSQHRAKGDVQDDDDASETSSISYGSAKLYVNRNSEHARRHPELRGVQLPEPSGRSFPPADVTVDRSRSQSRSKSRSMKSRGSAEDPPTAPGGGGGGGAGRKRGGASRGAAGRRAASSNRASAEGEPRREGGRVARRAAASSDPVEERKRGETTAKRVSLKETNASGNDGGSPSRNASRSLGEFKAASSARSSRHNHGGGGGNGGGVSTARSTPNAPRNIIWDVPGNRGDEPPQVAKSGGHGRSASVSKERSSSRLSSAARSPSPTKSKANNRNGGARSESGIGKKQRSRSSSVQPRGTSKSADLWKHHTNNVAHQSTSGNSRGNRSRLTSSTHPESLSSEEIARLNSNEERGAGMATRRAEEEGGPEPLVIYKKRAHRGSQKEEAHVNDATSEYTKPMTLIKCASDEKSHASSISSSSTIEESFADDDDDDGKKSGAKNKALSALQGARGGAKNFATMGKSALKLGGLKETSRKWQSALFM